MSCPGQREVMRPADTTSASAAPLGQLGAAVNASARRRSTPPRPAPRRSASSASAAPPEAGGGANILANLQTVCGPCHRVKTGREARFLGDTTGNGACPWDDSRHALKVSGPPTTARPKARPKAKRGKAGYDPQGWTPRRAIGLDPVEGES